MKFKNEALLTEYFTGTSQIPLTFLQETALSAMCKAVIVMEAANKGGALITARQPLVRTERCLPSLVD